MRRFPNLVPVITVIVIALILGGLIGWWASRPPDTGEPETPIIAAPMETNKEAMTETEPSEPTDPAEMTEPEEDATAKTWEDRLDEILVDDSIDTDQKANLLAEMIPNHPEEAQVELAGHLANLASDDDYAKTAALIRNEKLPESVNTVLMDDLYNRNDRLCLPLFLEVAKNEKHPLHQYARENLEQRISEDFGTNWVQWDTAIEAFLKEQGL